MPNRLANETSPYLLQHANNPVDWRPWSPEALTESKSTQKPIFLSIGYSACHWCHVMEHESFENAEIAAYLNEHFISIKVDREERPDLDQIYMSAVQLLTGRGGWPMSVFLTPELKPFFGGTYWPSVPSRGMPGFLQVLRAVEEAWRVRREAALSQSEELTRHIQEMGRTDSTNLSPQLLTQAAQKLHRAFDSQNGGFGHAPKFPHAMDLQLLLRLYSRDPHPPLLQMVEVTLEKMALGGIYDHLAGGFARYSVDERWLVPHFEKMLYDNALLMGVYLDAYQVTKKDFYAQVARECGDYLLTYMMDSAGGIHSTEDADSEGEEGKFYVWSKSEIIEILGQADGKQFCDVYDVTQHGNFEGHNILNLKQPIAAYAAAKGLDSIELETTLKANRQKLLDVRNRRIRPGKDDKVLTNWNGLAITALARAGAILNEPRFLQAAQNAAQFILSTMRDENGGLLHTYRVGVARQKGFLEDYANVANALVDLFEADGDARWLEAAVELGQRLLNQFYDWTDKKGGFFFVANDHETLIARQKDAQDQSTPSGNGMAATALIRLATLTSNDAFHAAVQKTLEHFAGFLEQHSMAAGQMLIALDWFLGPRQEWVLVTPASGNAGEESASALRHWNLTYSPRAVRWHKRGSATTPPMLAGLADAKEAPTSPTLFCCEGFVCQTPAIGEAAIAKKLSEFSPNSALGS